MHMRTLVVTPPECLRLNPSQGRIGAGSISLQRKESKRRRVAVRMQGKGVDSQALPQEAFLG